MNKGLEDLLKLKQYFCGDMKTEVPVWLFNIETALKALEIIIKSLDFSVELGSLPDGTPTYKLNVWCKGTPTVVKPISKDKFDLLKEVLK